MRIEFFPMAQSLRAVRRELDAAFDRVVSRGRLILDREVAAFEEEFAAYCGAAHCVSVGNGLDALAIALKAQGCVRATRSSCPATRLSRAGSRCHRSARYRSARMSTRTASTSTPHASMPC